MVSKLIQHDTKWVSPAPLWAEFSDTSSSEKRKDFQRPSILRFNNDSFMEELLSLMNLYPERLIEWKAVPETWREPMPTPKTKAKLSVVEPLSQFQRHQSQQLKTYNNNIKKVSIGKNDESLNSKNIDNKPLKLYQPSQLRFYLVTASLVCRKIGLPDRVVDLGKEQKTEFVMRRLLPKNPSDVDNPDVCDPDKCDEYAFVNGENGMSWVKVKNDLIKTDKTLLDQEERVPMFNVGYEESKDKKRKMLAGFIPVAKREVYMNTLLNESVDGVDDDSTESLSSKKREAIAHLFNMQVAGRWKRLISIAYNVDKVGEDWVNNAPTLIKDKSDFPDLSKIEDSGLQDIREKIQTNSWYVLVDMLQFFKDYIPRIYDYIKDNTAPAGLTQSEEDLYDALSLLTINKNEFSGSFLNDSYHYQDQGLSGLHGSIIQSLQYLISKPNIEAELDLVEYSFNRKIKNTSAEHHWPDFIFPLADPVHTCALPSFTITDPSDAEPDKSHDQLDALTELVASAIPLDISRSAPDVIPPKLPENDVSGGWFVIRCVHESPNCGPFNPALVSESTVPFKMAQFYDPDAPSRPITIPMPLDISPSGLRKYNQNAGFMISDMLCGKLRSIRKTTLGDLVLSVLPWPFHKDLPDPGSGGPCSKGGTSWGMFCSLSIPIVTICAFIVLSIMVTLFDIFFRWLPLFFICLPIPGLKGKK